MDAFNVYKTYLGIKSHFTNPTYDYKKYGKVKAKRSTFLNRKDKYFFERISKKYTDDQIVNLFVSNFLISENIWIGDFLTVRLEEVYKQWCKRNESIEYMFDQDVEIICNHLEKENKKFEDLFKCKNSHPEIFKMVMRNQITPETYVILDKILCFNEQFDRRLFEDTAYSTMSLKFKKYKSFVNINNNKDFYRKKLLDQINRYALT
jgi:hypothetical protein